MTPRRAAELGWAFVTGVRVLPRPQPRVTLASGRSVSAWMVRLVTAGIATGCTALVATADVHRVIAGILIVSLLVRPTVTAPSLLAVGAGLVLLVSEVEPLAPQIFVLAFGLHLIVELAAAVGDLRGSARVELRALGAAAGPFLSIQAAVQTLAFAGGWTASQAPSASWLPVAAGLAMVALAWGILLRLRPDR